MINKKSIMFIPLLMLLFSSLVLAEVTTETFGIGYLQDGNFNNTWVDGDHIRLSLGSLSGTYTSPTVIFDNSYDIKDMDLFQGSTEGYPNNCQADCNIDMGYYNNILYVNFDETTGTAPSDKSCYGIPVDSYNYLQEGQSYVGYSGIFDGANDYIRFNDNQAFDVTDYMTFMFAIYPTTYGNDDRILSKERGTNKEFAVVLDDNFNAESINTIAFFYDGVEFTAPSDSILLNQWNFVTVSYNTSLIRIFVDDELVLETDNTRGDYGTNTNDFCIGSDCGLSAEMKGNIDEFMVFHKEELFTLEDVSKFYERFVTSLNVTAKLCEDINCVSYQEYDVDCTYDSQIPLGISQYVQFDVSLDSQVYGYSRDIYNVSFDLEPFSNKFTGDSSGIYTVYGLDNDQTFNANAITTFTTQTDTSQYTKSISNPDFKSVPKVSLMDDGNKYIVSRNGEGITLYDFDGDSLNTVDGITVNDGVYQFMGDFIIVYSGFKNRIIQPVLHIASNQVDMMEITYDGNFHVNYIETNLVNTGQYHLIRYLEDEDIFAGFLPQSSSTGFNDGFYFYTFDVTGLIEQQSFSDTLYNSGHTSGSSDYYYGREYYPLAPQLIIDDVDNDGNIELVTNIIQVTYYYNSVGQYYSSYSTRAYLLVAELESDNTINSVMEQVLQVDTSAGNIAYFGSGYPQTYISGVTAVNSDGQSSNGKELFMAYGNGEYISDVTGDYEFESYKLAKITSQGYVVSSHPSYFDLEGQLLSNPFIMDCYDETGTNDIGIMTYDNNINQTTLMCHSDDVGIGDDTEYTSYNEENFEFNNILDYAKSVHPIENDGSKGSELLTPFGIFDVDSPSCFLGICNGGINKVFDISEHDLLIQPIDFQDIGKSDFLMSNDVIISYLDDGFTNTNAQIDDIEINPCIEENWAVNTTALIKVTGIDNEDDEIQYKIILYTGSDYEIDSGWSSFYPSGETFDYTVDANTLQNIAYLNIYARDNSHVESDEEEFILTIAETGVNFGDCSYISTGLSEPITTGDEVLTPEEYLSQAQVDDNAIVNGVNDIGETSGLGSVIIYIIVMIAIALGVIFSDMGQVNPALATASIFFIELLMIIIGTKIGIFSTGLIILLSVIGILIIGLWGANIFFNRGSVGGN